MPIHFYETTQTFHLYNHNISYVMQVSPAKHLLHGYWGKRLQQHSVGHQVSDQTTAAMAFKPNGRYQGVSYDLESAPQEYPSFGSGDSRSPGFHIVDSHGFRGSELFYKGHSLVQGKPALTGLPSTYVESDDEAQTLTVTMRDEKMDLEIDLVYSIFTDGDAITRHNVFRNLGQHNLVIERAMSAVSHFSESDLHMLSLPGAWARERDLQSVPLYSGIQSIESRRGSSSHAINPFFALTSNGTDEDHGQVFAYSLVYSGNFLGQVEVAMDDSTRAMMGLGSFDFSWNLESQREFHTPEVVMVYSDHGLGQMSRTYHKLYRERLFRGKWRDETRPVLLNNWEATYFDFNHERIMTLAVQAKEAGVELFVLDDGWFGKRDDDSSGLGDWVVNEHKCAGGLKRLGDDINALGLKFGLWFEPEMVSPDSDLYRAHPDWCLHVPGREKTLARQQLMLDFSRQDVCDNIIAQLSAVLSSAPIDYVKWDFNRNVTEVGSALLKRSQQKEVMHRYYLGLYQVLDTLTTKFPQLLFESCSGGGGRFDPGMLHYMPQTWTSDNTDAISRLRIQYGTSMVYPLSSMGSHVSACPNHQVNRHTPWDSRTHIAYFGTFGYELDLTKESEELKAKMREDITQFKVLAPIIHKGSFYRLQSPFEKQKRSMGNEVSWMCVSEDKTQAVAVWIRTLEIPSKGIQRLKFKGLNAKGLYRIHGDERVYGGDELMYAGVRVPENNDGDFRSKLYIINTVSQL